MSALFGAVRRRWYGGPVYAVAAVLCIHVPSTVHAHHGGHVLAVPSARCGWIEAEDLRDRNHLTDFCAQSVPADFGIRAASATREHLWIEAPADLAATLRDDDRRTAVLLRDWLERWRKVTGYRTASVILLRSHIEFARVETTFTGDVVIVR